MTLLISKNLVVSMHYKLTDNNGNLLDSTEGSDPLAYLHGAGNIIPGLEKALEGKITGDAIQVTIAPEEAYGEVNPDLVQVVNKAAFQGVETIEVGMTFEARAPNGATQHIVVTKVEGEDVTIDGNHPLAGVTLNFGVQIANVREATTEEINHGHIHSH